MHTHRWFCATRRGPSPTPARTTRRYVAVYSTPNGVMLSADRRGHRNYSNVYWKRAPPAEANTDTSDFFIKIRSGFHFVITDREDRGACLPGTVIYESPASKYNIEHPFAGGYPAPPPPSLPTSSPPPPPCVDSFPSFCSNTVNGLGTDTLRHERCKTTFFHSHCQVTCGWCSVPPMSPPLLPPSPPPSPPPFPSPFPVTTTASPPPEASLPPACDDGGGGDIGAIADGVVGGVAAVALISVAVWNYAKLCQDDYYIGAPVCRLKRFGAARSVVLCLDHWGVSVACPLYGLPPQLAMLLTLAASVAGGAACTPGSSCCVRHPRAASCSPSKSSPSKSRTTQLTRSPRKETPQDGKHTTCGWASGCCRRKPTECRDASHLRIAPTPSHTHCSPGDGGGAPCCAGTPVHMRIGKTGTKSITMSKPSRLSLRPAGSPEASLSAKA